MKLVALYSNQEGIFPEIRFHDGLNVVFARVKDPSIKERDSHNLGKTFLANLIDFCLLEEVTKDHPFKTRPDKFKEFAFYIQIETNNGQFVTIRRRVTGQRAIDIHVSASKDVRLLNAKIDEWPWAELSLEKALYTANELFSLSAMYPFDFRKGLRQFLRRQDDYLDEFRTSRFARGKDKDWKPYIGKILGFNQKFLDQKYAIDEEIETLSKMRKRLEVEADVTNTEYDQIKGLIEIRKSEGNRLRAEIDNFSFRELEAEINTDTVSRIEQRISSLNGERYTLDYELNEVNKSLENNIAFDIDKVVAVFNDVGVVMPQALVRNYQELIDFNNRLTTERDKRLRELRDRLVIRRQEIEIELLHLDTNRKTALEVLRQKEVLEKYRGLQKHLSQHEQDTSQLELRLSQLDRVAGKTREIEDQEQIRAQVVKDIKENVRVSNETYSAIRVAFADSVREVLNVAALLSVTVNQNGNIEFKTSILEAGMLDRETHEGRGTSYKKLLCACLDLSVLGAYTYKSFYRFVYHDGIFEGLDNRKKVSYLNMIRRQCKEKNLQYILTVIDSDLPRDERDQKLLFSEDEIIRVLNDDGDEGRLFRMGKF